MMKLILLACFAGLTVATVPKQKFEPACTICVDVMTDLDSWVTSDTTEAEIVDIMKNLCAVLGYILADLEASCNTLVEEQLPSIIEQIVNENFNPQEVCTSIGAC